MKHKLFLEDIENIVLKSKSKVILDKRESGMDEYEILYDYICERINLGELYPVKRSGLNGKRPPLYKAYWEVEEEKDSSEFEEELNFRLSPKINNGYYKKHTDQYKKDRDAIIKLNDFLINNNDRLKKAESVNERSFEIWNYEKFIKGERDNKDKNENRGRGKKILSNVGIKLSELNIYETPEPFVSYTYDRTVPQNVLIIENKDTFYTIRKYMQETGKNEILGKKFGTVIYGAGKKVKSSFKDFQYTAEKYLADKQNNFYYFGDLDYEGIGIYEGLYKVFREKNIIEPFKDAYIKMYEKAEMIGLCNLPITKENQNRNIDYIFSDYFDSEVWNKFEKILRMEKYIPQEIINVWDLDNNFYQ